MQIMRNTGSSSSLFVIQRNCGQCFISFQWCSIYLHASSLCMFGNPLTSSAFYQNQVKKKKHTMFCTLLFHLSAYLGEGYMLVHLNWIQILSHPSMPHTLLNELICERINSIQVQNQDLKAPLLLYILLS